MRYRLTIVWVAIALVGVRATAAVNVPLTVQEALYPGSVAGLARSADPVTVGIPLPDDATAGATDVSQLSVAGATVGQFRVLGRWPSGRIKWVLVDTQVSLNAGATSTSLALTTGSGNFGGASLATDNGSTITVETGGGTFVIRKAHFNGLDSVVVGGATIVASGASQGFVVTGPAPGQTTCGSCTTLYTSANDASSTAVIEENGPVRAVIKATGSHKDASGNSYMKFTVRLSFYRGKSSVKVTSSLQNADAGGSNGFATAYKGHQGYELRLAPTLAGTRNYSIGTHAGAPTTGTLGAGESVYLYQGVSQLMKWQDWCGFGCVPYTSDAGYRIVKNDATIATGTDTQYPQGWADLSDSSGAGLSIGVYQLAAYWPKSLEFNGGGSDVRIGIWARQNSQAYYQAWPQWSSHDLYLNFHQTALASPANEFLKFQHYLLGRAPLSHYNASRVFPYPLLDPSIEDSLYTATASSAVPALATSKLCCIQDVGIANTQWPLSIFRFYAWNAGGGANQAEFRWSYLLNYLTRGMTGRYLNAAHFYRFQIDSTWPHSDGFNWRDRPGEYNGFGFPTATSANETRAFRNWRDQEHGHWYGMTDYYFMTGDELVRDALLDGVKDWYLNPNTYQNGQSGGLYNTRSIGVQLIGAARFGQFLAATGDSDAAAVLQQGVNSYMTQVKPELCVSGHPAGCTIGPADGGPWNTQGVSRTRGVPWGSAGTSGSWCGAAHSYRVNSSFQPAILIQGLLELRAVLGPSWPEYWTALDLAYGMARWNLSENYVDSGDGRWDTNGFRFGIALDTPNSCPGESPEPNFQPVATQTTAMTFLAKYLVDGTTDWANKFKINVQKTGAALGITTSDFGGYQLATIYQVLNTAGSAVLTTVPITGVADNGGGSYTISWTVPVNAQSYRIKWGARRIVDWIGFDPAANRFIGDPASTMPWFAATNAAPLPAPLASGSTQSVTLNTGVAGLTSANFSVKAYITMAGGSANGSLPSAPRNVRARILSNPTPPGGTVNPPPDPSSVGADIAWALQPVTSGWPGYNGWLNLWYDPVSEQTILYGVQQGSASIYSTDVFAYNPSTNNWTRISGSGDMVNSCNPGTPSRPGNRHPGWQMAVDTKRSVLWLFGGVCQGVNRQDMYYLRLNANPAQNTWQQVTPAHYPLANNSSAMIYDPDDDVLFLFGSDTGSQTRDNWVYCHTAENPTPGQLTAKQSAAGCSAPDDWSEVSVVGGTQPAGAAYPGMIYDTATKKAILFGGMTGGGVAQNQTWAYDVPSRKWTRKALTTTAPPVYTGPIAPQPALAYSTLTRKVLYHQTSNTGAPADWEYDPAADTWTRLTTSGSSADVDSYMTYDASRNILIAFSRSASTGRPDVWQAGLRRTP